MPDSEPWTAGETVRAIRGVLQTLDRIETKLDSRPTKDDLTRVETAQARVDKGQDEAIKALEDGANRMLLAAAGAGATGLVGIVVALATR